MISFKNIMASAMAIVLMQFGSASADSIDDLQEVLEYTIRYENITPNSRQNSMRERSYVFNGKMLNENDYMMYTTLSGIIASDGVNRYSETASTQNFASQKSLKTVKINTSVEFTDKM